MQGERVNSRDLWRIDVNNGGSEKIASQTGWQQALSQDGRRLAWSVNSRILLASSDGKTITKLCDRCGAFQMAWSPDGASLAVQSLSEYDHQHLRLISATSGEVAELASLPPGYIDSLMWPPDAGGFFFLFFPTADRHEYRAALWTDVKYTWQDGQIWFCAVPGGQLSQVTHATPGYRQLFGVGPGGLTMIARRNTPMPGYWELMESLFHPVSDGQGVIVQLTVTK